MNIDFFRQDVHSKQLMWYGSVLNVNDIDSLRRIAECEEPNEFETYVHRWISGVEGGRLSTQEWPHQNDSTRDLTVAFMQDTYGKGRVSFTLIGSLWTLFKGADFALLPQGKKVEGTMKR